MELDWPYPFAEGKLFVLTLRAGLEGYHVNVDGRHVTSFPYRTVSNMFVLGLIILMNLEHLKYFMMMFTGVCARGCYRTIS